MKKVKENGRDRLIASALKLFSERSYHGVSVREICDDAHANPSLISFHFGGKEGLLEVLFKEELLGPEFQEMEKILTTPTTPMEMEVKLSFFLESYLNFYLSRKEVIKLYFEELERGHEFAHELLPETFGYLWDKLVLFLQQSQKQKFISSEWDINVLCYQIMGPLVCLIRGRTTSKRHLECSLEDDVFKKKLIRQTVHCLKEA